MCIYTCAYIHVYERLYVCVDMYTYADICRYTYTHMYIYPHTWPLSSIPQNDDLVHFLLLFCPFFLFLSSLVLFLFLFFRSPSFLSLVLLPLLHIILIFSSFLSFFSLPAFPFFLSPSRKPTSFGFSPHFLSFFFFPPFHFCFYRMGFLSCGFIGLNHISYMLSNNVKGTYIIREI